MRATADRLQAEADAATFDVWPENWHAVRVFIGMATQWHWAGSGMAPPQRVGLRLEALPVVLDATLSDVPRRWRRPRARLLEQLQAMEDAALLALRGQR